METTTAGIVFHVMDSEISKAVSGKQHGKVALSAVVDDLDLWEKVLDQLNGMELHRGRDFKGELIEVLKKKNQELEKKTERVAEDKDSHIQRLTQEIDKIRYGKSVVDQNLRLSQARVAVLEEELSYLKKVKEEIDLLNSL